MSCCKNFKLVTSVNGQTGCVTIPEADVTKKYVDEQLSTKQDKIDNIDSLIFEGLTKLNNGKYSTDFIEVHKNDVLTWLAYNEAYSTSMRAFDNTHTEFDRWSTAKSERTVTVNEDRWKYVKFEFSNYADIYQYAKINGILISETKPITAKINAISDEIDKKIDTIPDFVYTAAYKTLKRIIEWSNGSKCFLLGHITDIHSGGSNRYKHIGYLNELDKLFGFSILVNGGDTGLDYKSPSDINEDYTLLFNTKQQMATKCPWVFCKGNHERLYSNNLYSTLFNIPQTRTNNEFYTADDGTYGYYDNESYNVRVIYLNTTDAEIGTHYFISDIQLQWFINALNTTQSGWKVVVTSHFMPNKIGAWKSDGETFVNLPCFVTLRSILTDFANKSSGGVGSLQWNFSNNEAKLICILTGDSHFNNNINENGVNYIVRQGYGGVGISELPDNATVDPFSYVNNCLFDVLAIKDDGNTKLFRIGEGDYNRDLIVIEKILPNEYQQVEYLEGDGNAYIDTQYIPTNSSGFEVNFKYIQFVNDEVLGCGYNYSSGLGMCTHSSNEICFVKGKDLENRFKDYFNYHSYLLKSDGSAYIDGEFIKKDSAVINVYGRSFTLFCMNKGTITPQKHSYKYLKLYEGNEVIKHLIPCYRKSDNVAGMYDIINNTFLTNAGSGNFIVGRDV